MPWFPDFVSAGELARRETRAAGLADPVAQYLTALSEGDTRPLESVWPGDVVIHDPRAGEVRGHKQLRRFVSQSQSLLASRHARVETVAATYVGGRVVVEVVAHLAYDGGELAWPVAVVAESPSDLSMEFRIYCSQVPVDGRRHVRPAVLEPGDAHPGDVVARYQGALDAGDTEAVVQLFGPDGYFREPIGPQSIHRGKQNLRAFFTRYFSAGGGIGLQPCTVTDDGVRCAVEYNCVRWGNHHLPAQAGIGVYERGPDGLLAAVRVYDDIDVPVGLVGGAEPVDLDRSAVDGLR